MDGWMPPHIWKWIKISLWIQVGLIVVFVFVVPIIVRIVR